jgi:hypothetical protein
MLDLKQSITDFLNEVKKAYQTDLRRFRSTGQSHNEFRVSTANNEGTLTGANYLYYLMNGRKPGKFPPISAMLDYIRAKGIKGRDQKTGRFITDRSLAFLFARAIAEKGNKVFQGKVAPLNVDDEIVKLRKKYAKEIAVAGAFGFKLNLGPN